MKSLRRWLALLLILGSYASVAYQTVRAQDDRPLAIVMNADGPIMPPMLEYIKRGVEMAERRGADVLIIQLNTPGGAVLTTLDIIREMRASSIPVVVYVSPRNAIAGSAGAMITIAGHASAMAPETTIGASTPISSTGENLPSDARAKEINSIKAALRPYVEPRGEDATALANAMIEEARAVTASEALEAGLVDAVVDNVDDLLESLDGMTVQMSDGPRSLNIDGAHTESLGMSFIEQFLLFLTDPNIAFLLLAIGVQAVLIEISSPGGWVAGFIGAVCLTLAVYGMGVLPVNWFGIIFLIIAFVLFILDIKAPTHGALTAAGVASFIIGALVLFNSPGTPQFQQVSVPLVVATGFTIGLMFMVILMFALRALRVLPSMGTTSLVGKLGTARSMVNDTSGQVQLESELWTAEAAPGSESIGKGDRVEVVEVKGLRLKVRKIK